MSEAATELHFTAEQYKRGVEPYEYLYSIINNSRLHIQEMARLIEEAKLAEFFLTDLSMNQVLTN